MPAPELKVVAEQDHDMPTKQLARLVEALSARVADLEGQNASLRAAVRALSMESDAALRTAMSRLGQVRNIESRMKRLLEDARYLFEKAESAVLRNTM